MATRNCCSNLFAAILAVVLILETLTIAQSVVVNCRCGQKPWSTKDLASNLRPSRQCCNYFIESGEGNFTESNALCQIENEFIYKRFHSCCVSLIRNAYCYQQKLNKNGLEGSDAEEPVRDPWERYGKLFGPSIFG